MIFYLAIAVLGYLLLTTALMLRNSRDFRTLLPPWEQSPGKAPPLVSVCIPARNEEDTIGRCVRSTLEQTYPQLEVLVLDDGSEDRTAHILDGLRREFPERLTTLRGKPLPEGWHGKNWACQQLAEASSGEILLFLDADTRLAPGALTRTVRTMARGTLDMITVWPQQEMDHFWARRVIPIIYHALLTHLPVRYVRRDPRWLPRALRPAFRSFFAAACGQFLAFRREAYEGIGGHASVRDEIVEDVALSRRIKREGYRLDMFNGVDAVACRMYAGPRDMWEGFRKNFLAGFGGNVVLFAAVALWNAAAWILPWAGLAWGLLGGDLPVALVSGAALAMAFLQRLVLARLYGWSRINAATHTLGVLWFEALALRVLADRLGGRPPRWKGRDLD